MPRGKVRKKHFETRSALISPIQPPRAPAISEALRMQYGLSRSTFARIVGVTERTVTSWEKGSRKIGLANQRRIRRVEGILVGLARVMRREFIPTWLEEPSPACTELSARTPTDLLERGEYDAVESMIFFFESGVPF